MQEKGSIEISSKLKAQSSKPKLKTQNYLFCHPEGGARRIPCQVSEGSCANSLSCHPEDEVRRIPYQVSEGFFASLRMTIITQSSKLKTTTQNAKLFILSS